MVAIGRYLWKNHWKVQKSLVVKVELTTLYFMCKSQYWQELFNINSSSGNNATLIPL